MTVHKCCTSVKKKCQKYRIVAITSHPNLVVGTLLLDKPGCMHKTVVVLTVQQKSYIMVSYFLTDGKDEDAQWNYSVAES